LDSCWQSQVDQDYIPLPDGLRLQVIPTLNDLARCQKHHFAAFIRDLSILVVWDDDPKKMIDRTEKLLQSFVISIWKSGEEDEDDEDGGGKKEAVMEVTDLDIENGGIEKRETQLLSPLMVSLALALLITCLGLGARKLAIEVSVDGSYVRLALLVVTPVTFVVGMVCSPL
jgi:uncharacterized protein (DUF2267 family)